MAAPRFRSPFKVRPLRGKQPLPAYHAKRCAEQGIPPFEPKRDAAVNRTDRALTPHLRRILRPWLPGDRRRATSGETD